MKPIVVVTIIMFAIMMAALVSVNKYAMHIVDEINEKKPLGEKLSQLGAATFRLSRNLREYDIIYPHGNAHKHLRISLVIMILGFIGTGICIFNGGAYP